MTLLSNLYGTAADDAIRDVDFNAQTIIAATIDDTPEALTINEQTLVGRITGGNVTAVSMGIVDNNIVQIDDASVADNEYSKFTANGVEGRTYAEVLGDLSGQSSSSFDWNDQVVGKSEFKDYAETSTTPSSSSGVLTLDIENGNVFAVTLTENITTLNFNNPSSTGRACSFTLILTQDSTPRTVTWPNSVKWGEGTSPTISTASAIYLLSFVTVNAGTTWYGFLSGLEMA